MTEEQRRSKFAEVGSLSHMAYEVRLRRFKKVHAMRHGEPPYPMKMSLQGIANELVRQGQERVSRERIRQILKEPPRPPPTRSRP
jgi:hypothetical protein